MKESSTVYTTSRFSWLKEGCLESKDSSLQLSRAGKVTYNFQIQAKRIVDLEAQNAALRRLGWKLDVIR